MVGNIFMIFMLWLTIALKNLFGWSVPMPAIVDDDEEEEGYSSGYVMESLE